MKREIELTGVPDDVNNVISGFVRMSRVTQLFEDIQYLHRWVKKRCGNCDKWMCNTCPREKNVNGRKKGPSMNTFGCDLFSIKLYQIKYYNKECNELLENKYMQFIPEERKPKLIEG